MKFGIDVSHNNGIVKWGEVAKNSIKVDFAILKATEGVTVQDRQFLNNVIGCRANGIPWSAYHFATFNSKNMVTDAKAEAAAFIKRVRMAAGKPDLPLVLDIESNKPLPYTREEINLYTQTFLNEVQGAGYRVAIYSSPGFLNSYLPPNHQFGKYPLWVADYTNEINKVMGWKSYWIHQYTDKGKCMGVATACDLNRVL